jgi:hypothetical protein
MHPYWYARIISIFHAMVLHKASKSTSQEVKKMDLLFVRWFGLDDSLKAQGGWKAKKLHQIRFIEGDTAFGFIDPADVIRSVHLIPRFSDGRTMELLGCSSCRLPQEKMKIGFVIMLICMFTFSFYVYSNFLSSGLSIVI